ncbi:hypothetical protein LSTR_LSTR004431 [Laodelphax striatellus]|uniref:C2H2-type domain-containing protein n=1 Tax=Laodelphax striatellus TaxID=195883 RepID=A0A482XA19_LAOST|nr:hypothetical protein LSTR_LSTR004431 [Laodelphax striatellus]
MSGLLVVVVDVDRDFTLSVGLGRPARDQAQWVHGIVFPARNNSMASDEVEVGIGQGRVALWRHSRVRLTLPHTTLPHSLPQGATITGDSPGHSIIVHLHSIRKSLKRIITPNNLIVEVFLYLFPLVRASVAWALERCAAVVMPHGFRLDMSSSAFHPVVPGFWFDPRVYLYADPPPLDLSIKGGGGSHAAPITPPSTPSPSTPPRKRTFSEDSVGDAARESASQQLHFSEEHLVKSPFKKHKAVRKLDFDEDNTSPVSGTIIRQLRDDEPPLVVRKGDIDPAFNVVEVTEEAKAELAKIENRIGDYICRLCKEMYEDAFGLAQHRCSRIVHVEYRCPECDKVFNCPANLASHRRWHRPRQPPAAKRCPQEAADGAGAADLPCPVCHKLFRRQAYLRKHLATHSSATQQQPPIHLQQTEWHTRVATADTATAIAT